MEITQELVKELFDYHEDGYLVWKKKRQGIHVGQLAGNVDPTIGYQRVKINGVRHFTHRLIFAYHHGYMPRNIDHADRNKINNRIANLREASTAQNAWNASVPKTNTSGFKGVSWHKHQNKWIASIRLFGKLKYLGYFKTAEEAHEAYKKAAMELHGEFARFE